ncbi:MAG TPA: alpha/beta hydrolase, partial [Xanthobacteraceae bacterium]|nr:alpha/beta hydrolase [Xanthobacteraceae bacterium]
RTQALDAGGVPAHRVVMPGSDRNRHVLYLHGGAYVLDIISAHWNMVARLVRYTGCLAVVPLYPLAPEHTWQDAFGLVVPLYESLVARLGRENVIVMGDSAGGGMALALAQQLRVSVITLFHGLGCKLFDCLLCVGIGVPTRLRMPSCSRPSRTLRAAGAVARRRAILDCRCARRHVRRAGRDGRMVPIEQKDGTAAAVGRCRDVRCAGHAARRGLDILPATASATL